MSNNEAQQILVGMDRDQEFDLDVYRFQLMNDSKLLVNSTHSPRLRRYDVVANIIAQKMSGNDYELLNGKKYNEDGELVGIGEFGDLELKSFEEALKIMLDIPLEARAA